MDDADSHGFVFLGLNHQLTELNVFYELDADDVIEIGGLSEVPPVLAC